MQFETWLRISGESSLHTACIELVWASGQRYVTTSQNVPNYITKSTRPSWYFMWSPLELRPARVWGYFISCRQENYWPAGRYKVGAKSKFKSLDSLRFVGEFSFEFRACIPCLSECYLYSDRYVSNYCEVFVHRWVWERDTQIHSHVIPQSKDNGNAITYQKMMPHSI